MSEESTVSYEQLLAMLIMQYAEDGVAHITDEVVKAYAAGVGNKNLQLDYDPDKAWVTLQLVDADE